MTWTLLAREVGCHAMKHEGQEKKNQQLCLVHYLVGYLGLELPTLKGVILHTTPTVLGDGRP